jgi:hypothetical protein
MITRHRTLAFAALLGATVSSSAVAQRGGPGFMFGEPRAALTIRTGWAAARAGSDLFEYTSGLLTLDRADFSSPSLDVDVSWHITPTTMMAASLSLTSTTRRSEFRDYVDNNEFPIEQTTEFARRALTLGIKQYIGAPGHSIGRYAWVPTRTVPYVGIGAGTMYYNFRQSGDFIDFQTFDVFSSQYASSGWVPTAYARGGIEYSLSSRMGLVGDARYNWASAELSDDFSGFERLDLSGLSVTVGLNIRY